MKECEYKRILTEEVYLRLLAQNWEKKTVQVNFYYSNHVILNKWKDMCIRIRCKESSTKLQIKEIVEYNYGVRISNEYETAIDSVPNRLPQWKLQSVWSKYCFGDVFLQGFMVTERCLKKIGNVNIALDRNNFGGCIDYEIEFECEDSDDVHEALETMKIGALTEHPEGKYERFCRYMEEKISD